jgi:hypothetical protein
MQDRIGNNQHYIEQQENQIEFHNSLPLIDKKAERENAMALPR